MPTFSVTQMEKRVRIYQLQIPFYTSSVLCCMNLDNEYTVYKWSDDDDVIFEKVSTQFDPRLYYVLKIHEDCPGIDHIGIVHFISGMFTKAGIPILYVNTYGCNLIFISEVFYEKATELMKKSPLIQFD